MGMGLCRICRADGKSYGDTEKTNVDYDVTLQDQGIELNVCGLWEHYALEHNLLPPKEARDAVMAADPGRATGKKMVWRGMKKNERISIYFVEETDDGYNHAVGDSPDTEFIDKLNEIIDAAGIR